MVMLSSLSYAIYIVGVNRSKLKEVATLKLTFYVLLFGVTLFWVRVDFGRSLHVVNEWYTWVNLLGLAVLPTALSFWCTTQAVQYIGSTPTAILGALEPVTAVVFGVTIFGESLTPAHRVRHPADYRRGDHHHRGREYHRLFHPPAETVPAVAPAVMLKSAAHETKEGMIR